MSPSAVIVTGAFLLALMPSALSAEQAISGLSPIEAAAPLRLTLAEAIEQAERSSARLAQLRALESAAAGGWAVARSARMPRLDLSGSYFRSSNVPELTLTAPGLGLRTIFPNIPNVYRTSASLSLPVYTGGRLESAVEAARQLREAAGKDLEAARRDLNLETTTAYWLLVTGRESERVLGESVASFEAHLKDARNRRELGLAPLSEVLAVQVERDRAELDRLEAENAFAVANANLARLLDLSPGTIVEPTEPLEDPPVPEGELDSLVAAAKEARAEVPALRFRIAAAEANVLVERAASWPQASLTAGYDYANPNNRILPLEAVWRSTWSISLNLAFTAFDGGRRSAAASQALARAEAARSELEELERRIRFEVTTRWLELKTAQAAVGVSERNLEAARESLRVSRDRYREGLAASSELLDAETALLRAGLDRTSTVSRLHIAIANLNRAAGR